MADLVLQPTQEGEVRRRVLFWLPVPLPVLGLVLLLVGGSLSAAGWTILLAASVGMGTLLLSTLVQPTPLPEGLGPQASARRSLHRFRQFTTLRICLALVAVVFGATASILGGGAYPMLAALALAWPQLLMALPTFFTITRARRAMEAWGTTAYLWHALSRPARVTWPIATPLARDWREWRARREEAARERQGADAASEGADAPKDSERAPAPDDGPGDAPEPGGKGTDTPGTGTRHVVRVSTVHRATRQIMRRGGALGLAVRRGTRSGRSTRRPRSHKN
ncbi:hypothetical protein [Nocardiopsis sp. CNT312]|uniref:hypothetical protein n=1 Tax=Nocardiopsis sp. CNT312 TaxID=1137268 RepID=UPI00048C98B3|nr:hypothetical protein [Nocardiopsis sp. CNT312]